IREETWPRTIPKRRGDAGLRSPSANLFDSDRAEATVLERRFEELLDAPEDLARPRVGRRGERRLHFAERLELAEELHVAQARRARQDLPDALDLARERVEPEAHRADAPRLGVLPKVRVEHRRHDRFEDRRLVFAVPHVFEDEEVARIGLRPPVEIRARREQLEELHDAGVAQRHALCPHLEDEALVLREELLAERRARQEAALQRRELPRVDERSDRRLVALEHLV